MIRFKKGDILPISSDIRILNGLKWYVIGRVTSAEQINNHRIIQNYGSHTSSAVFVVLVLLLVHVVDFFVLLLSNCNYCVAFPCMHGSRANIWYSHLGLIVIASFVASVAVVFVCNWNRSVWHSIHCFKLTNNSHTSVNSMVCMAKGHFSLEFLNTAHTVFGSIRSSASFSFDSVWVCFGFAMWKWCTITKQKKNIRKNGPKSEKRQQYRVHNTHRDLMTIHFQPNENKKKKSFFIQPIYRENVST